MNVIRKIFVCSLQFAVCSLQLWAHAQEIPPANCHKLVDEVYARLTPEERVAQICAVTVGNLTGPDGRFSREKALRRIPHGIGHVCQFACNSTNETAELRRFTDEVQKFCMEEATAHIPAICHEEVITGVAARGATTYPQQIGVAASWNAPLLEQKCRETSADMEKIGANFALSPMADVIVNSNWTRLEEGYGESGYLGAVMGTAFVRGLQASGKTAACTKHFLGYGTIGGGQSRPWRDIYEEVILPHEAMIRAGGAAAVMTSYDRFKGEQAVSSPTLIQYLLRGYIGFDGTVVSDYGAVTWDTRDVKDPAELEKLMLRRAADAIKAGNDVDLPHGRAYEYALKCVELGMVGEAELERCVKNSLLLKARVGLLGGAAQKSASVERNAANTNLELARQSIVLLKNDGALPLAPDSRVALVGPNANSVWAMLGDYTYQTMQAFWRRNPREWDSPHIITLKEGMEKVFGPGRIVYSRGCGWSNPGETGVSAGGDPRTAGLSLKILQSADPADFDEAVRMAGKADAIVCAMGENFTLCGESRQREHLTLPGDQAKLVRAMIATGKPVILVLFGGRNLVLEDLADGAAAVVQAWYPGETGGLAVAEILAGRVNPSGKLPITYPRTESRENLTFGDGSDTPGRTRWPFGHGLSYTTYRYSNASAPAECPTFAETLPVEFLLENTGRMDGAEVAQLYITAPGEPVRLRAFARVELGAGEGKRVKFSVPLESFARWRGEKTGSWAIEPGEYTLKLAASAWDVKATLKVRLSGETRRFARREKFFAGVEISDLPRIDLQGEIDHASAAGGGCVTVPEGVFQTRAIQLKSNVELRIPEGSRLVFTENLEDCLPAVRTSFEGIECMGYSPLIYAFGATNVAVSGKGTLEARVEKRWRKWGLRRKKNPAHDKAKAVLAKWSRDNTPIEEREFWKLEENLMRPPFIQFNRSAGIRIEGVKIRQSPFWTIHLLCCDGAEIRDLDVYADCKNSDGLDIESSRNVLVENCVFEQGDDAIVVKSGINHEGRRRAMPSENVVIRNCVINEGHSMLSIGSELSGGIRNILMEDCRADSTVDKVFFIKTNPERGGFVENVVMRRIKAKDVRRELVSAITDYFWKPGMEPADGVMRATPVSDVTLEDISAASARAVYSFRGWETEPIRRLTLRRVDAGETKAPSSAVFCEICK